MSEIGNVYRILLVEQKDKIERFVQLFDIFGKIPYEYFWVFRRLDVKSTVKDGSAYYIS